MFGIVGVQMREYDTHAWCQVPSEISRSNGSHLLVNDENKYRSMWIRAYSSLWMLVGFASILYLGHLYIWVMIVVIQIKMVTELFNLLRRAHEDKRLPGFRLLNWFLLPALLIAINDVTAYFFGFFFGRTLLIKLSPKKTWEGFIGASIATMISAFVDGSITAYLFSYMQLANILGRFLWLTCPRKDLSTSWLQCDPGPLFKPEYYSLHEWVPQWDFGDSIPGHGGFTDRMDCQMVMAVFAYIYHRSFVVPQNYPVEMILDQVHY
ncbi:hypothetical protein RJ639_038111 [Escallonia herrerae]|uniref:phosphatidate cytidylyltransferase n=1 Tax=Escallonia herrerae TaxID=1293975 RepID=A0AA88WM01_9ASTE|nr:hypothetical protein RJ639_038111 [Escallonia herrerae]